MPESPERTPGLLSPRHILIIAASPSHDPALAPALAALRREVPEARLCLYPLGPHAVAPAAVDETLHAPTEWTDAGAIRAAAAAISERAFAVAVILTPRGISPYPAGYVCYLAGVPVRIGQSLEFGGRVLTHWVKPTRNAAPEDDYSHLLRASGLLPAVVDERPQPSIVPGGTL